MKRLSLLSVCFFCCFSTGFSQENGIGSPEDKIERPCVAYDRKCIRNYFANHSKCKKSYGPAPDTVIRDENHLYFPRVNITMTNINEEVRGLNGRIDTFYINRETDNLVISVEFKPLSLSADVSYFRVHRRDKEPVVAEAFSTIFFESVLITCTIPDLKDLQLEKAECTAFNNDAITPTITGPGVIRTSDPEASTAALEFLANPPNNVQEYFLTDAIFFVASFIQHDICDFGLKTI